MPHDADLISAATPVVRPGPAAAGLSTGSATWPIPFRLPMTLQIVTVVLCFRVVSASVGFIANITIPDYQDQGFSVLEEPNPFWDRFARYDAGWYYGIAANGYSFVEGGRSNLAFFPVYPQLMGVLGRLFGGDQHDFYFAGIVITWLSFALAMALLYKLARLDLPEDAAVRATIYTTVFPSAYFFGVVYSEALFLLTLVGAALAFRTGRWLPAALAAAVMTATRVNGVMFLPALAWLGWQAAASWPERRRAIAAALAGLAGIGGYSAYNYTISGNPFEWYNAITRWGYHPGGNPLTGLFAIGQSLVLRPMAYLAETMAPYDVLNAATAVAALGATPFVARRFGGAYAAVIVLGLVLPLSSGQYEGLGRYCSVLFPIPILLASIEGKNRHLGLIAGLVLFYTLGLVLFGNVHPLF